MPSPSTILKLLQLEDRTVPSAVAIGEPWPVPDALTLSFAPDTATVSGQKSPLADLLKKAGSERVWQLEILRAFQTWASVTNLNIGLVTDDGSAFGTPGQIQGDERFGDIRVGARLMSPDALANAVPFDWAVGTWSGDILFNTAAKFGINPTAAGVYDLFTTTLHEAGHVFGLHHADDPFSVMSERYAGRRVGLSAAEVAEIQGIHGARLADRFEGPAGNDTWATATTLSGTGDISVTADLTTAGDADYYRFLTAANQSKFVVRLGTSGVSLLTARVTVYDAAGNVVGADVSTDPTRGDLEVKVDRAAGGSWYTVRVEAARADVFGIGRYELVIAARNPTQGSSGFVKDSGANDTAAGATPLDAEENGRWSYRGVLDHRNDVDYYRVTAPSGGNGLKTLVIEARSLNKKELALTVEVFDAAMNRVPGEVIGANGGTLTFRSAVLRPGENYFVRIGGHATDDAKGNYRLGIALADPPGVTATPLLVGTLARAAPTATGRLVTTSSRLFQFNLNSAGGWAGATITLTVTDATGKRVVSATHVVGETPLFLTQYLAAGEYTVTLSASRPRGSAGNGPGVTYWLSGGIFSDPVGPYGTSTGSGPGTGGTTGTTAPPNPPPIVGTPAGRPFTFTPLSIVGVLGLPYSF